MASDLIYFNRRTFLKGVASAAGVTMVGALGCDTDSQDQDAESEDGGSKDEEVQEEGIGLFSRASIGNVELKNRLIRAATEESYADHGSPTERYIQVFTDLAAGGVGAIISGITMVAEEDALPFELYAFDDTQIDGFKQVRQAVRETDADCKLFAQIGHTGYRYVLGKERIGPSAIGWPGEMGQMYPTRAMEIVEVERVVEEFSQAARRFKEGGWDGVEIYGSHGNLISMFLSPFTNKRTDRYGGSVLGRVQIVKEIVDRSRELVGDDFPIFIKMNSDDRGGLVPDDLEGGIDEQMFVETAAEIAKLKIDAIDVSGNNASQAGATTPEKQSYFKDAAVAADVEIPIILTGGNRRRDDLNAIVEGGEITFVGLARPLIREPDLCNKWMSGQTDDTKCISCNMCTEWGNLISGMRCHQEPA